MYSKVGSQAYKPGLENIEKLCEHLGNPQVKFKSIHIAGTNGKGSCSHLLASILQCNGYKTGLYTSPHLKNFTERIRINGIEIPESYIVTFINQNYDFINILNASFFEVTTALCFNYFAENNIDIAIIETGLGGRLDSTNIITPILSLITNIGWDHMDLLGNTLPEIAFEKAGIIKPNTPVVICEYTQETKPVFTKKANESDAPIFWTDEISFLNIKYTSNYTIFEQKNSEYSKIKLGLQGKYQEKNLKGILICLQILQKLGFNLASSNTLKGLLEVKKLTGIKGRWQTINKNPLIICDVAHNINGITEIIEQLNYIKFEKLSLIIGFVKDKEIEKILPILPKDAFYIFTQASIPRALDKNILMQTAKIHGLNGEIAQNVNDAIKMASKTANKNDLILILGSIFLISEIENI